MRIFFGVLLALELCAGQSLPDGNQLQKKAAEAAARLRSMQYTSETVTEILRDGADPMKTTMESHMATANPGKMRIESSGAGGTTLIISNAEGIWMYVQSMHQYVKVPAALGAAGLMANFGMKLPDMATIPQNATTLREETVGAGGRKYDCWVVENKIGDVSMPMPGATSSNDKMQMMMKDFITTSWIDKKLLIDVRSDATMKMVMGAMTMGMHLSTVKKDLKIDVPLDDALFTFTPPGDAKEVKDFGFFNAILPKADLVGKDAAAFELKGIDGKSYSLASLKGKTVMLDFWATWCGPCRASVPAMEEIFAEYHDRGLVVIAVDAGEDRSIVDAFVKQSPFLYPVALSGESGILEAYKVSAYPTFILIQDGKVIAQELGFRGEEMLRGMMEAAKLPAKP